MAKKNVLITGITGTVAKSFVKEYIDEYNFYGYSRNDSSQQLFMQNFPDAKCFLGPIEDSGILFSVYEKVRPDIVIHAAAIKHVDLAEKNPIQTSVVNIIGSNNIVAASTRFNVPITIGISTDKACDASNVYGMSKYLMEKAFLSSSGDSVKFCCTRFANVAGSTGSVIPRWDEMRKKGEPLTVTDINMSRLMFSPKESSLLIREAIRLMENGESNFILTKKMKTVKIYDLALVMSNKTAVIGTRSGEKLYENLVSEKELEYTEEIDNDYIMIRNHKTPPSKRTATALNSLTAQVMDENQIRKLLQDCDVDF